MLLYRSEGVTPGSVFGVLLLMVSLRCDYSLKALSLHLNFNRIDRMTARFFLYFILGVVVSLVSFKASAQNPLIEASVKGDFATVKQVVEKGGDVNQHDNDRFTPLMGASYNGHPEIVKYFIDKKADVNAEDNDRLTALKIACYKGHLEVVKLLIKNGAVWGVKKADTDEEPILTDFAPKEVAIGTADKSAIEKYLPEKKSDLNAKDKFHQTPFLWAVEGGRLEVIKYLIEIGNPVNDNLAQHALKIAILNNKQEIAKYLIEKGADMNKDYSYDGTPLLLACSHHQLDLVKYLIEKGVNINAEVNSTTPLIQASQNGHLEIVKYLIEKGANINTVVHLLKTALTAASQNGHLVVVKYLVEKGANVHEKESYRGRNTSLMLASENGHLEIVKFFMERVGNPEIKTTDGYTALYSACQEDRIEIVKYLIENGLNVNKIERYRSGFSPLMVASQRGHLEIVKYLVYKFADIDMVGDDEGTSVKENMTALISACMGNSFEVVNFLIEKKANANIMGFRGSALMVAVGGGIGGDNGIGYERKDFNIIKCLVEKGRADVNLKDHGGRTALINACSSYGNNLDQVKYLVEKGADMNAKNIDGQTSLMKASRFGHLNIVKYLVEKGADVNAKDTAGQTVLRHAAYLKNNEQFIDYLKSQGATE